MIIYLPLEIAVRELQGYLLIAAVAISRGHQVVILGPNDIWLYKRLGLLQSGCYLIKNINIPAVSAEQYNRFLGSGFEIYCQEQEPPILRTHFERHLADYNITPDQMLPFKAVFCYGERDTSAYQKLFAHRDTDFFNTGSPRIDMWSSRFSSIHRRTSKDVPQPYVLIVSNFSYLMGKKHFSEFIRVHESMELLDSFVKEKIFTQFIDEDFRIGLFMILAVKHLALGTSGFRFLIRPHPNDRPDYWRNIFSKYVNVEVTDNSDSITPWIQDAAVVIQNGCTSAIEAVLQKVPVISYGPDRTQGDLTIPNKLGIRARTLRELDNALELIQTGEYQATYQVRAQDILKPLLNTEGNSAFEIVRIMEDKSHFLPGIKVTQTDLLKMRLVRYLKDMIDMFRRSFKLRSPLADNLLPLDFRTITLEMQSISSKIRGDVPKVHPIGKMGMLIDKAVCEIRPKQ